MRDNNFLRKDFWKLFLGGLVVLISILICIIGLNMNRNREIQIKAKYAEDTIGSENARIDRLNKKIKKLYQDNKEEFLVLSVKEEAVKKIKQDILGIKSEASDFELKQSEMTINTEDISAKKSQLLKKVDYLSKKIVVQDKITTLLVLPPDNWQTASNVAVVNEKASQSNISESTKDINGDTSEWGLAITSLLNVMDAQCKQYDEANEFIDAMMDGQVLTEKATIENITYISGLIEQLPNEKLKEDLNNRLKIVEGSLGGPIVETVSSYEETQSVTE